MSLDVSTCPLPRLDLPAPDVAAAVKAASLVADPTRAGILALLRNGPHCVCEMAAATRVRQNNVSNHLARLRDAGLVRAARDTRDARWVYYERDEDACTEAWNALASILGPESRNATTETGRQSSPPRCSA